MSVTRITEDASIYQAYRNRGKLVKEASEHKASRTEDEINALIQAIFRQYNITSPRENVGEEFWRAVEDVKRISHVDGKRLADLAKEWEEAYKREKIVKPHLQSPWKGTAFRTMRY